MALFDDKASTYDDWCATPLGSFVDSIEKHAMKEVANPREHEVALDLGCGTGAYSYWLLDQGLHVTGIDISEKMLAVANEKIDSNNIHFVRGDVHTLPFQDESFDLVLTNITLEFTDNPQQVFLEVMRVLKNGGRFVCGFIGKDSAWGQMYQDKGKKDQSSVFSKAQLFDLDTIQKLGSHAPVDIKCALYVSVDEFENMEQAKLLEEQRVLKYPKNTAGYIVAKWLKE